MDKMDIVNASHREEDDIEETSHRKEDDIEETSLWKEDDIEEISHWEENHMEINNQSEKDDIEEISYREEDDINETGDNEETNIEVISDIVEDMKFSDSEENIELMMTFYNRQKTNFINASELFRKIMESFGSFFPCHNHILKLRKPANEPSLFHVSDVLLTIGDRLGNMHTNLLYIDHELQLLDNVLNLEKECISRFQNPAIKVYQLIVNFNQDMIQIVDKQIDILQECKSILISDESQ